MSGNLRIYVDEVKTPVYLLIASLVSDNDAANVRKKLRTHVLAGQRRIHFHTERESRRQEIFHTIQKFPFSVVLFISEVRHLPSARDECLNALVEMALECRATEIVLERDESLVAREAVLLANLIRPHQSQLTFRHELPQSEPVLWISDAVGWAYRRGGDWRKKVSRLQSSVEYVA